MGEKLNRESSLLDNGRKLSYLWLLALDVKSSCEEKFMITCVSMFCSLFRKPFYFIIRSFQRDTNMVPGGTLLI